MKKDWMVIESELDEDQMKVLMATLEKSCIVEGCAGSGKSVLALIKTQHLQKKYGNDYVVIVFTKALRKYMAAGKEYLGLENNFYYHWEWKKKLNCPSADYIIVDEIQDFTKDEINEFIKAARKGFFFFGDTAQSIYGGIKPSETLIQVADIRYEFPQIRPYVKSFSLYRNYRLPLPVARLANEIGIDLDAFDDGTYKSRENTFPRIIEYSSPSDQIDAVYRIINNRNLDDVGILLPTNQHVKKVYEQLQELGGNYEMQYNDRDNYHNNVENLNFHSKNPKIMTYHSAKGLQFESVFLPFLENFSDDEGSRRKALYVAMTRTYRNLYMMYSIMLPEPLASVNESLYVTTETDEIEDI